MGEGGVGLGDKIAENGGFVIGDGSEEVVLFLEEEVGELGDAGCPTFVASEGFEGEEIGARLGDKIAENGGCFFFGEEGGEGGGFGIVAVDGGSGVGDDVGDSLEGFCRVG